jgi:ADP-ribosylglycohydrolase
MTADHYGRILGCLYGLAIGDALGMPTSFLPPEEIKRIYQKVTDFEEPIPDHIYHAGYRRAQVTDDTEQTILIAETLLECRKADPNQIARALLEWFHRVGGVESNAVGPSSKAALVAIEAGRPLVEAGKRGDTNGAAMRISPVAILNSAQGRNSKVLIKDIYQVCLPTHGSDQAVSGASALASGITAALQGEDLDAIVAATIVGAKQGKEYGFPVIGPSVAKRIELALEISKKNSSLPDAASEMYQTIGAGVAMAESVPSAIGLFYASKGNPQDAILTAVNMGGDCDTVASMVGALAGAFKGVGSLPQAWIDEVEEVNKLYFDQLGKRMHSATKWWNHE